MALPISRSVVDWPLILCGPILRRVTPNSVAVFVALKSKARVVLEIYKRLSPGSYDTPLQSIGYDTVALGANLHVIVAEWRSNSPLAANQVYGYDLLITVTGGAGQRLGDLTPNLLAPPYKLGYDERLPSFALPPNLKDLVVIHGSCRKAHGNKPGNAGADALPIVDQLIANTFTSALQRPHFLVLTGDQIYADDVSVALLSSLRATAIDLLGWASDEKFPPATAGGAAVAPGDTDVLPGPKRRSYIKGQTGFSSTAVDGHLMFLGEFYAMYLFGWSDDLWPRDTFAANQPIRLPLSQELRPGIDPSVGMLKKPLDYLADVDADRANVQTFALSLPAVRRALANVPSLMMFDDHDVTDDWYLNGKWDSDVRASAAGRQIIRNALAAYAIFQDWGNHPENYKTGTLGQTVLDALTFNDTSKLTPIESQVGVLDAVLDLQTQRTPLAQRMRWDWQYSQPDADYQIVALDTRTFRWFTAINDDSPGLITTDPSKSDAQLIAASVPMGLQLLARKPTDSRVTILLSPAPVIGHPLAEVAQRASIMMPRDSVESLEAQLAECKAALQTESQWTPPSFDPGGLLSFLHTQRMGSLQFKIDNVLPDKIEAAKAAAPTSQAEYDAEAWSANRVAFEDLLRRLSSFGTVVILSGDVHYGYSAQMAYFPTGANITPARMVQFVSSAMRNESDATRAIGQVGFEGIPTTQGWLGFDRDLTAFAADFRTGVDTRVLSSGATDPAVVADLARFYFQTEMNERFTRPAVIPSGSYIDSQLRTKVANLARDPTDKHDLTDWRYAVTYLTDIRDAASRAQDWTALSAALGSSPSLAHHKRMFVGSGRSVVGFNNIGLVRFSASVAGGTIDRAVQRLYWQKVAGASGAAAYFTLFTEHTATITTPAVTERPEVEP